MGSLRYLVCCSCYSKYVCCINGPDICIIERQELALGTSAQVNGYFLLVSKRHRIISVRSPSMNPFLPIPVCMKHLCPIVLKEVHIHIAEFVDALS